MDLRMKSSRQAIWIVGLMLTMVAVWSVFRPLLPHSELAENNFQANLIRLQAWQLDPHPATVLVGSSITGRLLPRYFTGTPLGTVANLGLDGSGPEAGLRLLLQSSNLPPVVLIEGHRLAKNWSTNDDLLLAAIHDPQFTASRWVTALRADVRPSSILFSLLKSHSGGGSVADASQDSSSHLVAETPIPGWEERMRLLIDQLRQHGTEICLYRLPVGRENLPSDGAPDFISDLAWKWGIPYLDVDRECKRRGLVPTYTDGLHMTPASARETAIVLAELTAKLPRR
jgi:hypothetical protein